MTYRFILQVSKIILHFCKIYIVFKFILFYNFTSQKSDCLFRTITDTAVTHGTLIPWVGFSFFHDYIHLFFILNLSCILLNSSKIVNILHLTKCIYAHFCNHPQKKMKRIWFPTTLFILISSFFTYKKCLSPFYNT